MKKTDAHHRLEEKCGIVGVFTPKPDLNLPLALLAARGVQHRGQQGAGVAIKTKWKIITQKGDGLVQNVFPNEKIKKYNKPNLWTLVHCRYGTHGTYVKENLQPCVVTSINGEKITIVHNGEFAATSQIRKKLKKRFAQGTSDTYLFAQLLAQTEGKDWEEKIAKALEQVTGSFSLIIGVNDAIYATRDPFGIRPLVFGKIPNGWLVASETHAFDKVGATVIREIQNGEILKISKKGLKIVKKKSQNEHHFCDFEWAYFSKPNSLHSTNENKNDYKNPSSWLSVTSFRERCGIILAKESPITHATFAVGIPDSGVSITTAYSYALHIPYRQVIIRDHFDPNGIHRLFMKDDQKEMIGKKVMGKLLLVPDKNIWKDAVVVVGDDSIVRGNVSKQITEAILSYGAREVHWIVGFPPVTYRCHLGVSIRTRKELMAPQSHDDPQEIAKAIGATSVRYISPKSFIQARLTQTQTKISRRSKEIFLVNGGCGGCVTGLYPVSRSGEIYESENDSFEKIKHLPKLHVEENFSIVSHL